MQENETAQRRKNSFFVVWYKYSMSYTVRLIYLVRVRQYLVMLIHHLCAILFPHFIWPDISDVIIWYIRMPQTSKYIPLRHSV
jgi:hypothetical protein